MSADDVAAPADMARMPVRDSIPGAKNVNLQDGTYSSVNIIVSPNPRRTEAWPPSVVRRRRCCTACSIVSRQTWSQYNKCSTSANMVVDVITRAALPNNGWPTGKRRIIAGGHHQRGVAAPVGNSPVTKCACAVAVRRFGRRGSVCDCKDRLQLVKSTGRWTFGRSKCACWGCVGS